MGKGAAASGRFLTLAPCYISVCALLSTAGVPGQEAQASMGCLCPAWMAAPGCISGGGGGVCGVVDTCTEVLLTQAPPHAL